MTSEMGDISCVKRNLVSLGLGYLSENTDSFCSLLDKLIKVNETCFNEVITYKSCNGVRYKGSANTHPKIKEYGPEKCTRRRLFGIWVIRKDRLGYCVRNPSFHSQEKDRRVYGSEERRNV
jgi:hypothetical protein